MGVVWVIVAAAGAALAVWSLARVMAASPGARIPYFGEVPVLPRWTILMRSVGMGVLVYGSLSQANTWQNPWIVAWWMIPLVFVMTGMIATHNHRLAHHPAHPRSGDGTIPDREQPYTTRSQ